jgi:hypothetical protein
MKLYCEVSECCTDSEYSEEEYGKWEEHYEFEVKNVFSEKSKYLEEFDLNVSKGDVVYSLSVKYSTGDSFGYATGKGELVWIFSKREYADTALLQYKGQEDKSSLNLSLEMPNGALKKVKFSNVASGYFENLEEIEVNEHVVK